MTYIPKINERDYPGFYQASDYASKRAQSYYVNLVKIDLIAMVLASGLSIYNYHSNNSKLILYIISGLFLLLGLIFTIIILSKKFEDVWYQGRALAESCKTLTWRFMIRSELFESDVNEEEVSERFVNRIKDLTNEFKDLKKVLNPEKTNLPIISQLMLDVRELSLNERKGYYVTHRIEDQKNWYSKKAIFNEKLYNRWFGVIIICQAFSIISIVFLIKNPDLNWNITGLFTTIASASISWLQLKRHQELKQAYTTASQELNFIASSSKAVSTDDSLSKFVLDSENAISREHTLWLAQKRN